MSASPLIKVAASAFSNGAAVAFKKKINTVVQQSPLKSTEENEQSPSKIINIYSDTSLFNPPAGFSTIKNPPEEQKVPKTYSKVSPEEAEVLFNERKNAIKEHIKRTKNNGKVMKKNIQDQKLKSALKKQQLDHSTAQSQQIDISRTSQNFRRKSIDQPIQTVPKPHPNIMKISFHQQLLSKKQQLLNDIAKLDMEIVQEKEKKHVVSAAKSISPRTDLSKHKQDMKSTYEKRQQMKKVADQERQRKEMEQCTFKPLISNTSRKLNTSQSSKLSPQTSPKQMQPKKPRSQSQESNDVLQNSREELNCNIHLKLERLNRINEKYNVIIEQSNKLKNQMKF